ncbi:unnamed protein product [Rangifer tarandus platyrhynchus]|uniref:Uncharacterized protein n=1 Tax=Rangifer tarandus platyrhynchus TaxID=3082113 RepID=A0ABN8Y1L2_RANTA|nr:unnamed protein product [Rangifer tarandus platyrhynchus]
MLLLLPPPLLRGSRYQCGGLPAGPSEDTPRPPETPGRAPAARAGRPGDPARAPRGPPACGAGGGGGLGPPPAHSHPAAPGWRERRGASPPPDRPLWAGRRTGREGEPGEGAGRPSAPTPNAAAARPLLEEALAFGSRGRRAWLSREGTRPPRPPPRDAGDPSTPSSDSRRVESPPQPLLSAASPLNWHASTDLDWRDCHTCGDSPSEMGKPRVGGLGRQELPACLVLTPDPLTPALALAGRRALLNLQRYLLSWGDLRPGELEK